MRLSLILWIKFLQAHKTPAGAESTCHWDYADAVLFGSNDSGKDFR